MMTILDEEEFVASAVVYPGSTEEVQMVVLWANKHVIPLFPISMGRNRTSPFPPSICFLFQALRFYLMQWVMVVPRLVSAALSLSTSADA